MKKKTFIIIIIAVLVVIAAAVVLLTVNRQHSTAKQLWTCPMHPEYISDRPGDCPICGMKLVKLETPEKPVESNRQSAADSMAGMTGMQGMDMAAAQQGGQKPGSDRVTVNINPEKQQLIGVKTDSVMKRPLGKSVDTVGVVAYDPELYYAQQDYIQATQAIADAQKAGDASSLKSGQDSADSAKTRLKVMGLTDQQIKDIGARNSPDKSLLITDSGSAWVYAQVFQDDLAYVKRGQSADITSSSTGRTVFEGDVVAIDPALNPETRSARVRIKIKETNGMLKPEMYVDVKIKLTEGTFLSIPSDAVLDTGARQIAFVDKGDGYFEPRNVILGAKMGDYYVVKGGVAEGEKIVVNANFLIDSESQLKAAISNMTGEHKH